MISLIKNSILADKQIREKSFDIQRNNKTLIKVGYTASESVLNRAATFDSDLRNFENEVDENPVYSDREYEKSGYDKEKRKTHLAFLSQLSGIEFDWNGTGDTVPENNKDYDKGYYRTIKEKFLPLGESEMREVLRFDERLRQAINSYEKLGYEVVTPISPSEDKVDKKLSKDSSIVPTWIFWVGGIGIVIYAASALLGPAFFLKMVSK